MDKNDYTQATNSYVTEYIKFGDAKAGSVLGFMTALVGVMVSVFLKLVPEIISYGNYAVAGLIIAAIIYMYFIYKTFLHSFNALSPETFTAGQSLNSFPDIASFSTDTEFVNQVEELKEEDYLTHYSRHNWALSKIALEKFGEIGKSISYLKKSLFTSLGFAIIYLILSNIEVLNV